MIAPSPENKMAPLTYTFNVKACNEKDRWVVFIMLEVHGKDST